ncbi:unnamed protein product [Miscanthus lutarioriparius]|uniref:Uncharacterized protein n=1 Tax=Miscanthus lutarioriparius TaxID=422564 RepID=A0A811SIB8_9POAL|nr:unnamed protein product [Miscanthus lutarioriparius]
MTPQSPCVPPHPTPPAHRIPLRSPQPCPAPCSPQQLPVRPLPLLAARSPSQVPARGRSAGSQQPRPAGEQRRPVPVGSRQQQPRLSTWPAAPGGQSAVLLWAACLRCANAGTGVHVIHPRSHTAAGELKRELLKGIKWRKIELEDMRYNADMSCLKSTFLSGDPRSRTGVNDILISGLWNRIFTECSQQRGPRRGRSSTPVSWRRRFPEENIQATERSGHFSRKDYHSRGSGAREGAVP